MVQNQFPILFKRRGSHVAFAASRLRHEDRFWAESCLVEFFKLMAEALPLFTLKA
jgi:predicted alpha/beta-fold hydrolase